MFDKQIYQKRRTQLINEVEDGIILLMGNDESPMNYTDNTYHFRQDSNFLYFIGIDQPHLNAIIDCNEGTTTLYGDDISVEYIVWMGPQPSMRQRASKSAIEQVAPAKSIEADLAKAKKSGRTIHILPPYRAANKIKLHHWLQTDIQEIPNLVSEKLIKSVVKLASKKGLEEVAEMENAVNITRKMHTATMQNAKAGMIEAELAGLVEGLAVSGGGHLAYSIIMTINGQTLHNHSHSNTLVPGRLLLGDYGAETAMHYAADITRTIPVDPVFTEKQKEIYQIVLDAEMSVINKLKPGITYLDMHLHASHIIADGLKALGLMKGDTDEAVAKGAHALFFPHGLGHMIGLDVHDMEDLGEQYVGYGEGQERSKQFGLKSLRLARNLEEGFVLTVEPGIYFIPELIQQWKSENKFEQFLNYSKIEEYLDFGGIRIEDDVLITADSARVLGQPIAKTIEEVEELRKASL
ncbi:MAG: aminopeptidase P family protein [Saprospiraceae bacterium]|nr:aminopeptidase P family protein [Saprospiraceae bacterium]